MAQKVDYQELIDELKSEINTGSLSKDEVIQILRLNDETKTDYNQIIDWYYNKEVMEIELSDDETDTKDEINEKSLIREQYKLDESKLENITADACLTEMLQNTITKNAKKRNPFF